MPVTVHYNAHVVTVPPRIEAVILFLLAYEATICQAPVCSLEFACGHGREVKGKLKVELPKPAPLA